MFKEKEWLEEVVFGSVLAARLDISLPFYAHANHAHSDHHSVQEV